MKRLSLRARLLLLTIALLATGLGVGGYVATSALERYLVERVDTRLHAIADVVTLAPLTLDEADTDNIRQQSPSESPTKAIMDFLGKPYLAYLAPDGTIIGELSSLRAANAPRPEVPWPDRLAALARKEHAVDVATRDGEGRWRMLVVPYEPSSDSAGPTAPRTGGYVMVAASLHDVAATIERLRIISVITAAGLLLVLGAAGWFAVRAGLRPLRRIEDTATAIAGGDLARRVPDLAAPRTEVGKLSAALNGMLRQIDTALGARTRSEEKMRRFVADVSHELRTPLFGIKGFAELYLMGGLSERDDVDHTMHRIDTEAGRLAKLTEDLLLLAQLDAISPDDTPPLDLRPADLRTLAADAAHDVRALDTSRRVRLTGPDGGHAGAAPILGDEAKLRQVVVNLVGNVLTHTPRGTEVRIGVGTSGGEAVFEIADSGPGLASDEAELVFDRFYRVDSSRTRDGDSGAGLGLAIVRSLVTAHGGRVELHTAPGDGATFRIAFSPLDEHST